MLHVYRNIYDYAGMLMYKLKLQSRDLEKGTRSVISKDYQTTVFTQSTVFDLITALCT